MINLMPNISVRHDKASSGATLVPRLSLLCLPCRQEKREGGGGGEAEVESLETSLHYCQPPWIVKELEGATDN